MPHHCFGQVFRVSATCPAFASGCAGAWVVAEDRLQMVVLSCGWNVRAMDRGCAMDGWVYLGTGLCVHVLLILMCYPKLDTLPPAANP